MMQISVDSLRQRLVWPVGPLALGCLYLLWQAVDGLLRGNVHQVLIAAFIGLGWLWGAYTFARRPVAVRITDEGLIGFTNLFGERRIRPAEITELVKYEEKPLNLSFSRSGSLPFFGLRMTRTRKVAYVTVKHRTGSIRLGGGDRVAIPFVSAVQSLAPSVSLRHEEYKPYGA